MLNYYFEIILQSTVQTIVIVKLKKTVKKIQFKKYCNPRKASARCQAYLNCLDGLFTW